MSHNLRQLNQPAIVWDQITEWGRISGKLTFHQQQIAADIAKKIRQWKDQAPDRLTANEINSGLYILELVLEHAPQLLENMPDDVVPLSETVTSGKASELAPVSLEQVQLAVAWDKRKKVLDIRHHLQLKEIAEGRKKLNTYTLSSVNYLIKKLINKGFTLDSQSLDS